MMDLNSRVANGIGRGILAVACSAGLLICAAPVIASTGSSSVDSTPLIAGHTAVAVAACPGPSHITGGGFGIDPPSTPGGNVTTHTTSFHPNDDGTFSALSANSTFGVDSTLTATARCESSRDGKLATIFDGCCTPIDPGHAQPIDLNCLPGTHVVSAGPRSTIGGKMVVVEDRRLTDTTWQITGRVPTASTTSSDIGGWAVCERNGSSRPIIERSTVTPYLEDTRTDGTATCDNRTHVVGGGFLFLPFGPGSVPVPYVDRSVPLGNTGWSVAAYDLSLFNVPPGSTMTTYAYCRSNKPKKKKKKKHHHRNGHKKSSKAAAASLQPPAAGALSGLDPVVTYGAPG